jgi:hypothetical protein
VISFLRPASASSPTSHPQVIGDKHDPSSLPSP